MTFLELNTNLQRAWLNIVELQFQVIKQNEQELMDFQRDQLMHGKDAKGETLQPYQSTMYAEEKNARNPLPGKWNPDLKDTGSFHEQMFAVPVAKSDKTVNAKVSSKDSKTPSLTKKYGQDIFGLSGEFEERMRVDMTEKFGKLWKKAAGLK